ATSQRRGSHATRKRLASGAGSCRCTRGAGGPSETAAVSDLRVALVHPYSWPEVRRGGERYVEDLAVYLAGHGVDVHVVTGSQRGFAVVRRGDGVTVHKVRHVFGHRLTRWNVTAVDTFGLPACTALVGRRY